MLGSPSYTVEVLLTLQNDCKLNTKFSKFYQHFCLQNKITVEYLALWDDVIPNIIFG